MTNLATKKLNEKMPTTSKEINKLAWAHTNGFFFGDVDKEVTRSKKRAFKCYLISADMGDAEGQFWTGYNYMMGRGVKKDLNKAEKYLTLAVEQGHLDAPKKLENVLMHLTLIKNMEEMRKEGWDI